VARILIMNMADVSTREVSRQLWMLDSGDIAISPMPIDTEYLEYIAQTLGFDASTVSILPGNQRLTDDYDEFASIGFTALSGQLVELLERSPSWDIVPWQYTVGVAELADEIGLPLDGALKFAAQRGPDLLNRKSHFRQLAVGARVPIADGSVVVSATALAKAIERHLPKTGNVIVKQDNSRNGRGNITVTKEPVTPMPGSRETWQITGDPQTTATALWHELTDDRSCTLVVETYHETTHCFWFEFLIDERGEAALLNSGTFRRRPDTDPKKPALVWVGLDLPAEIPGLSAEKSISQAMKLVNLCAQVGYRGYINVDAVLTPDGEILFNEINGRWGGALVLDFLGRRLIGKNYTVERVISSFSDIPPMPLAGALKMLKNLGIHYSPESREGILIICGDAKSMEFAVIASSWSRSREIEDEFRKSAAAGNIR
jgi:hypothetical protein